MFEQETELEGTLHVLPFDGRPLPDRIKPIYENYLNTRTPRDILVLKRFPDGVPEFTSALRDAVGLEPQPNVKSIARHASTVLNESNPERDWLTYEQRIEFLAKVLDGFNWGSYFDQASEQDSFGSDVGQLLLDATWQGGFNLPTEVDGYDELIEELAAANEAFHDKLHERDLAEQANTVPQAIEALDDDTLHERISREFDIVLAVEFEEYSAVEREYLATLTESIPLICVGEKNASIDRIKKEPGDVRGFSDNMDVVDHDSVDPDTALSLRDPSTEMAGAAYAQFLAEGTVREEPDTPARVIAANTLDEQVREVANEIEYLRAEHGWEYDEFTVALRSVGDPMPRVRRNLRLAGVPTASAGVNGLEQDLAVRELHALAQYHIDADDGALDLLQARVPTVDKSFIQECVVETSIAESLKRWIISTDLKKRIASESGDIDAREQFQNIERLLTIAEFIDEQDFLDSNWFEFRTMLNRAITYDAPYAHTADVNVPEGGVEIGDVSLLKDDSQKVVFLLNVIDAEYPGSEPLSPLFPTAWIRDMEYYPAVTQPTVADIEDTYPTASVRSGSEFETYHAERTRRQLAIGARAAEEQLYFCTYDMADTTVGKQQHQSRYLHEIRDHPELPVEEVEGPGADRDYYTLGSASAKILAEPWAELERIQAVASQGGSAEAETAQQTFAAIQKAIEEGEDVSPRFVAAVDTQFDFARGAIRPERAAESTEGENE